MVRAAPVLPARADDQRQHGQPPISFVAYLHRADFAEATFENWEAEFLQMGVYVLLTAWYVQKGSGQSKPLYGVVVVLSICLRQKVSAESKPVGSPDSSTGDT